MALLLRFCALFRCFLREDSRGARALSGDADGDAFWARTGGNHFFIMRLLGGIYFVTGLKSILRESNGKRNDRAKAFSQIP